MSRLHRLCTAFLDQSNAVKPGPDARRSVAATFGIKYWDILLNAMWQHLLLVRDLCAFPAVAKVHYVLLVRFNGFCQD